MSVWTRTGTLDEDWGLLLDVGVELLPLGMVV